MSGKSREWLVSGLGLIDLQSLGEHLKGAFIGLVATDEA